MNYASISLQEAKSGIVVQVNKSDLAIFHLEKTSVPTETDYTEHTTRNVSGVWKKQEIRDARNENRKIHEKATTLTL